MQQIERYGVIALVFLLITIVAVSFWGDSKSPGFWSRLTGKSDGKKEQSEKALILTSPTDPHLAEAQPPLTPPATPLPPTGGPGSIDGNTPTAADHPNPAGSPMEPDALASGSGQAPNPFLPGAQPAAQPQAQPSPHVAVPQSPAVPAGEYVVQKGDSLASIARRKLGAESRWVEIQAANKGLDPKSLQVGDKIVLPSSSASPAVSEQPKVAGSAHKTHSTTTPAKNTETKKATLAASKSAGTYKVKKGDGLRAIARSQLGDESRWKEILAVNPGLEANRLMVGETIKLPVSHASSSDAGPTLASAGGSSSSSKPQVR